jgi:type III secretion protein U
MASKDQGADKTEKPTPKRIRDARKEGNVSKSRELTATVLTLGWLVAGWLLMGFMYARLQDLFEQSLRAMQLPFRQALIETAGVAFQTLLWLSLPLLAMAVFLGVIVEFLQIGPIATMKKLTPNLDKLNPVEGIKRMFSMDNLVELIKSILKSAALIGIGCYVLWKMMPDLLLLPHGPPGQMGSALWHAITRIVIWTIVVFFFVSALDVWYQKFSYTKQLRMSRRDIRQEVKENEGDPYIKSRRRQLHQEWAQQNILSAVRGANVVVTNPTHIAIALQYELGVTDLPVVVAKGEGDLAEQIKRTAEEAGVPILQNIPLARGLNEKVALDEYVDSEFFDAVAEVLFWAENVRRDRGEAV